MTRYAFLGIISLISSRPWSTECRENLELSILKRRAKKFVNVRCEGNFSAFSIFPLENNLVTFNVTAKT